MKKLFFVLALIGFTMLFSSCAKLPQEQLDAVTAAVDSTKVVGADVYVPELYQALTDSLASVNALVEAEKSKFFSSYKNVKEGLTGVSQMATEVLSKTELRKAELVTENDSLLVEVQALVDSNMELVKVAPKGKEGKLALEQINSDIESINATVLEVETLVANGDILGANTKLKAAKELALTIKTELETVIAKVNGK